MALTHDELDIVNSLINASGISALVKRTLSRLLSEIVLQEELILADPERLDKALAFRRAVDAEAKLKVASTALEHFAGDEWITKVCDRKEHIGWWDGNGDWCPDCGGYQPREFTRSAGPNKASVALSEIKKGT